MGETFKSPAHFRAIAVRHAGPVRALAVLVMLLVMSASVLGQDRTRDDDEDAQPQHSSPIRPADDPKGPRRHFRLQNPAKISDDQAMALYARLKAEMVRNYRISGNQSAAKYQDWTRLNRAPYPSATHGRRLVNNYANHKAQSYGRFENAGTLPVGAIIAKDSIAVTADGQTNPGPLFLMEKMPAGFSFVSGDWRYTMIMPDGSLFGTTNGEGSQKVKFCVPCHLAVEKQDHLFFPPKEYRRR